MEERIKYGGRLLGSPKELCVRGSYERRICAFGPKNREENGKTKSRSASESLLAYHSRLMEARGAGTKIVTKIKDLNILQ